MIDFGRPHASGSHDRARAPLSTVDLLTILGVALITSKGAHGAM
ncbi:hypothetical protein [Paracoccus mutanolyticus]|nr:hypothetical protein [Paracoccus mutanolyticus]